jgi:hypothetical protein
MINVNKNLMGLPKLPLNPKTLSELIGLTPKRASRCLSVLHRAGRLTMVSTNNHCACPVLKKSPRARVMSARRAYRNRLTRRKQRNYKDVNRGIASKIAWEVSISIERIGMANTATTSTGPHRAALLIRS